MAPSDFPPPHDEPQPALPPAPLVPVPADTTSPFSLITATPPTFEPVRRLFNLPGEKQGVPHPNFLWAFVWCVIFLFVTQVPGAVIAVVMLFGLLVVAPQLFPPDALRGSMQDLLASQGMSLSLAVAFLITEMIVIGFSCLILRLIVGRDWPRQISLNRLPTISHLLFVLAAFPAMVLLANISYALIKQSMPNMGQKGLPGMEEMVKMFSQWPWPFAVLVIGLGPGIGEELWCRGFLGRGLVAQHGVWLGVLFTSFLFGLIHIDPWQGTMAMLMGLWLHYTYLMTRSLWVPMLLHFLNNSFAVVSSRIPGLEVFDQAPEDLPGHLLISTVVVMVVVAFALYQSRARLVGRDERFALAPYGIESPPEGGIVSVAAPKPSWVAIGAVVAGFLFFAISLTLTLRG